MKRIKIKNRTYNKILKGIIAISVSIFMLSICCVDSETWMPFIIAIISLIPIWAFYHANKHLLEQ